MKEHIGDFHWVPIEAFSLAYDPPETGADALTVMSLALCHTDETKRANRDQTIYPSESWARARVQGQNCSRALQLALADTLNEKGYPTVVPSLLPEFREQASQRFGQASSWSERHVAYISGLGTFGLSGGLITSKGQAARFGSLIIQAEIPPTARSYDDPFGYCLHYLEGSCAVCAERCPSGSIDPGGRSKPACKQHLDSRTADHVRRQYGFDGYGCGLCQTGVPCESGIPERIGGLS